MFVAGYHLSRRLLAGVALLLVVALVVIWLLMRGGDHPRLTSGPLTGQLAGSLVVPKCNAHRCRRLPVPDTVITFTGAGRNYTARTGAQGQFKLVLPRGVYQATAQSAHPLARLSQRVIALPGVGLQLVAAPTRLKRSGG
jgi:hypothetical protein